MLGILKDLFKAVAGIQHESGIHSMDRQEYVEYLLKKRAQEAELRSAKEAAK